MQVVLVSVCALCALMVRRLVLQVYIGQASWQLESPADDLATDSSPGEGGRSASTSSSASSSGRSFLAAAGDRPPGGGKPATGSGGSASGSSSYVALVLQLQSRWGAWMRQGLAVQNGLDDVVTLLERVAAVVLGQDVAASSMAYGAAAAGAVAGWALGYDVVAFAGVCWWLRPPALRCVAGAGPLAAFMHNVASRSTDDAYASAARPL